MKSANKGLIGSIVFYKFSIFADFILQRWNAWKCLESNVRAAAHWVRWPICDGDEDSSGSRSMEFEDSTGKKRIRKTQGDFCPIVRLGFVRLGFVPQGWDLSLEAGIWA